MQPVCEATLQRLQAGQPTRILAFGSSNTERRLPGMHWFDCLDLALQQKFGRPHRCINTGIGGNTSRDLLARFEQDAAFYQPHLTLITIGGNDCNPEWALPIKEFEENLKELKRRFDDLNCLVIFQTYYSVIPDESVRYRNFLEYSEVVREVAAEVGAGLIDNLSRWERLRKAYPELYRPLMEDQFHVVERGNKVMGLDIVRQFGLGYRPDLACWAEAIQLVQIMDRLEMEERS